MVPNLPVAEDDSLGWSWPWVLVWEAALPSGSHPKVPGREDKLGTDQEPGLGDGTTHCESALDVIRGMEPAWDVLMKAHR